MRIEWHVSTDKEEFAGAINHESGPLHVRIPCVPGKIESILADIHLEIDDDEKIFMNGYQTWTACPEYTKNDKIRGLHGLPKFMIDHYSFDRYGDYHFVDYPNKKGITHGFSWTWFKKGDHYRFLGSLDEDPGYTSAQLVDKLAVSRKTLALIIKSLKEKGIIERIGSDRKGYWKINTEL